MLDLSAINKNYFSVKLEDGTVFELNPPKIKVLNQVMQLTKTDQSNVIEMYGQLVQCMVLILGSNRQGKKIKTDFVENTFDIGQMQTLLTEYLGWVVSIKNDPN